LVSYYFYFFYLSNISEVKWD